MQGQMLEQQGQAEVIQSPPNAGGRDNTTRSKEAIRLLSQGNEKLGAGDAIGAQSDFESALLFFNEIGDKSGMAVCQFEIGVCYRQKEDHKQAYEHLNVASCLLEEVGNLKFLVSTLTQLAMTAERLGEHHQQVLISERAINICRHTKDIADELGALVTQVRGFSGIENEEGSRAAIVSINTILSGLNKHQIELLKQEPGNLGLLNLLLFSMPAFTLEQMLRPGERDLVQKFFKRAIVKIMRLSVVRPILTGFITLLRGSAYKEPENDQVRKREVVRVAAEATLIKGRKLVEDGHWQRGLESLRSALNQFRELRDLDGKARSFVEIGSVQMLFGDYELAELSFWDAERFFKKLGREEGFAFAELKLGTLALERYDYEKARRHLQTAEKFFQQNHDQQRAQLSGQLLKLADEYERSLAPI